MKTFWLLGISAVLGIVLGVATSWARLDRDFEPDPLSLAAREAEAARSSQAAAGLYPRVAVDEDEYDFGSVAPFETAEHAFVFENRGEAPLKLGSGGTSCAKCTVSSVPTKPIAPGETAEVVVQYHAGPDTNTFRQTATIVTTDPQRPRVELTVSGKVIAPLDLRPSKIVFTRISAGQASTARLAAVATMNADFAIESFDLVDRETARFFDVAIEPLPAAELQSLDGKRGYQVSVTVKPGMPLGPLRQKLVLHTNLPDQPDVSIPIEGSIDSDISLAGPNFDRDRGLLTIGPVGREGAERKLWVRIHGENRRTLKVSVASCTPPLQATLGEPSDSNAGSVVQIPLVVKIPPNSPSGNFLSDFGKVMLETTDPEARQVRIWVQFAVEE